MFKVTCLTFSSWPLVKFVVVCLCDLLTRQQQQSIVDIAVQNSEYRYFLSVNINVLNI